MTRDQTLAPKRVTQRAELVGPEHLGQLGLRAQPKGRTAGRVDEQLGDLGIKAGSPSTLA